MGSSLDSRAMPPLESTLPLRGAHRVVAGDTLRSSCNQTGSTFHRMGRTSPLEPRTIIDDGRDKHGGNRLPPMSGNS